MEEKYSTEAVKIINKEIVALLNARDLLDYHFDEIITELLKCQGKIVIMGVGKSGHVASKMAATFSSLGTPSFFISPSDAIHGSLGAIAENDVVILISHRGESLELIQCLPYIKIIECTTICITSNIKSTIAQNSDFVLNVGVDEEACYLNLAPTASTTATLVIGDALAIIVSKVRDFTAIDFGKRHPAGKLGIIANNLELSDWNK